MNYKELDAYCSSLRGGDKFYNDAQLLKIAKTWHKVWGIGTKGTDPLSFDDEAADKVARELKIGEYGPYLPEPIEYEEILASQELINELRE